MAFLLQDLPDGRAFARFKSFYPQLDPAAVSAFLRIVRVGSDLLAHLDAILEHHGLSHGRWITLILLRREESLRALPRDLAIKQGVTKATMTGLLAGLERAGLVRREPADADGRCSAAVLTTRGVRVLDAVMPGYYEAVSRWLAPLTPDEQIELAAMLDRVRAAIGPVAAPLSAPRRGRSVTRVVRRARRNG